MYKARTFCQFFFNNDTKKLTDKLTFDANSSGCIPTLPIATAKHKTLIKIID